MSTAAERTIENPELSFRFRQKDIQEENDRVEFITTADRIIGLLQDEPIDVELKEGVVLSFYPPSDDEYIDIMKFRTDGLQVAVQAKHLKINSDDDESAMRMVPEALELVNGARNMLDSLNNVLARLSVDPSFTPAAFKRMPRKYKYIILNSLCDSYAGEMNKTRKFRTKSKR